MLTIACVALLYLTSAAAHMNGLGVCPKPKPMKEFDIEKIMGQWYVSRRVDVDSKCLSDYFYTEEDGDIKLSEERLMSTEWVSLMGNLTSKIIPTDHPAMFLIQYHSLFPKSSMRVLAADYDNYVVLFKCMPMLFFHRWSASILVKDKNFNDTRVLNTLLAMLESHDLDLSEMDVVDYRGCKTPDEADLAISIDGDELTMEFDGKYVNGLKDSVDAMANDNGKKETPKPEADDKIEKLKPGADDKIEKLKPEADDKIEKLKPEADDEIEKLQPETDDEEEKLKPEADDEKEKLNPETDDKKEKMKPEADEEKDKLIPKADDDKGKLNPETDKKKKLIPEADDDENVIET